MSFGHLLPTGEGRPRVTRWGGTLARTLPSIESLNPYDQEQLPLRFPEFGAPFSCASNIRDPYLAEGTEGQTLRPVAAETVPVALKLHQVKIPGSGWRLSRGGMSHRKWRNKPQLGRMATVCCLRSLVAARRHTSCCKKRHAWLSFRHPAWSGATAGSQGAAGRAPVCRSGARHCRWPRCWNSRCAAGLRLRQDQRAF